MASRRCFPELYRRGGSNGTSHQWALAAGSSWTVCGRSCGSLAILCSAFDARLQRSGGAFWTGGVPLDSCRRRFEVVARMASANPEVATLFPKEPHLPMCLLNEDVCRFCG